MHRMAVVIVLNGWLASIAAADIVSFPMYAPSTGGFPTVRAVSDDGSVLLGISPSGVPSQVVGLRWSTTFAYATLNSGAIPSADATFADGLSADGSVVAGTDLTSRRAFRWTAAGAQLIDPRPAGTPGASSSASGVSADGSVMVGAMDGQPARWTQAAGLQQIGLPAGTTAGSASRVSADGTAVVGTAYAYGPSQLLKSAKAFRWTSGAMVELTGPAGRAVNVAADVSADGHVAVGNSSVGFTPPDATLNEQWLDHPLAARWLDGGAAQLLPLPGGADWALATATNADGTIVVGNAGVGGSDEFDHPSTLPWIWTSGSGTQPLGGYLQSLGLNLSAWSTLGSIADISADGRTITGNGEMFISPTQTAVVPWVVMIPSPMPPLLALPALGFVCRRRRSRVADVHGSTSMASPNE